MVANLDGHILQTLLWPAHKGIASNAKFIAVGYLRLPHGEIVVLVILTLGH